MGLLSYPENLKFGERTSDCRLKEIITLLSRRTFTCLINNDLKHNHRIWDTYSERWQFRSGSAGSLHTREPRLLVYVF